MEIITNLVSVVTGIVCAASIICSLTPTPKDDALIARLYKILEVAALNIYKAKQ
jgi:Na+-transporting NADH:ubiquinone oxidoreductase subunit NqrC